MSEDKPLVLVVEDDTELAALYEAWLSGSYRIRMALGGREAIESLDGDVDVVLLDRRMPDVSGDEVLEVIRDRGIDCRVAMVTAVEPDTDILEMGFDDYLVKPISREDVHETVDALLVRSTYDANVQEFFSLASKKAVLESEVGQVPDDEEYRELERRLADLETDLEDTFQSFESGAEFDSLFRELGREAGPNG